MFDPSTLSEAEAHLMNRLIEVYPASLGYSPERDEPVHDLATNLIDGGAVERVEIAENDVAIVSYRLTDEHAEAIRLVVATNTDSARYN